MLFLVKTKKLIMSKEEIKFELQFTTNVFFFFFNQFISPVNLFKIFYR